jgi:hypothetical protein
MLGDQANYKGAGCPDGNAAKAATDIYLDERRTRNPLNIWLPRIAGRVAAICPSGSLRVKPSIRVDARRVTAILGTAAVPDEGSIQLEPWLSLSVVDGMIAEIMVDLAKVRHEEP